MLMVQRAGFEPANPYGKGFLIGRSSQSVDLESLAERTQMRSFTFDLAWLPLPYATKSAPLSY